MNSLRDTILTCDDIVIEGPFKIQAWGVEVYVRSLSGTERDKFEATNLIKDRKRGTYDVQLDNLRARLVEMATCDKDGNAVFKPGDAAAIGKKNAGAIAQIYDIAARLSGITKEDLEEIAKNSSADQSDGSTSA